MSEVIVQTTGGTRLVITPQAPRPIVVRRPGDMAASVYDPQGIRADAFNRANHTGTQTLATISDAGTMAAEAAADYTKTVDLAAVATTGAYADLSGTPSLAAVAISGAYSDLSGLPTLGDSAALDVGTTAGTVAAGDHTHADATTSVPGFMAAADKTKLNAARETLTANRTYYVRTDGSNSNTGLTNTSGGAFLTLQKACDVVATLDFNGFTVTVQVGDGTYAAGCIVPVTVGQSATNKLVFKGNTSTPGNVIVSVTGGDCFASVAGARALIQDMELRTTTSGNGIHASGVGSELQWGNIRFGACAANHVLAEGGALATCASNYSIVGNAVQHCNSDRGLVEIGSKTITLTGTPAFSVAFINASQGHVRPFLNTYIGSATGPRYRAVLNGTINTFGAGATALPGDAAGTTATGGQYA